MEEEDVDAAKRMTTNIQFAATNVTSFFAKTIHTAKIVDIL